MNNLKDTNRFINELVRAFPEIHDEVLDEDYEGLITLQMGCFKKFTQSAIDHNDWATVSKCYNFVNENIGKVERRVENALYISYLEKLNITKGGKAEKLLPDNLRKAYYDLAAYNSTSSRNDKLNNFLNDYKHED